MNQNRKSDSHQFAMDLWLMTQQTSEDSGPFPIKGERVTDPRPKKSNPLNREMFAMWGFVIFTFAGLIFALCVIWAKCNGN